MKTLLQGLPVTIFSAIAVKKLKRANEMKKTAGMRGTLTLTCKALSCWTHPCLGCCHCKLVNTREPRVRETNETRGEAVALSSSFGHKANLLLGDLHSANCYRQFR